MYLKSEKRPNALAVPLRSAVLCVDCESVSGSPCDACPVCGSRSVFSIAPMLGGSLLPPDDMCQARDADLVRFDLAISIVLKQMEAKDLNATVEGITDLIRLKLGQSRVSFHIDVDPVPNVSGQHRRKAA